MSAAAASMPRHSDGRFLNRAEREALQRSSQGRSHGRAGGGREQNGGQTTRYGRTGMGLLILMYEPTFLLLLFKSV